MKKVLIITYYWPPSGGVGAQRWLKFAKYLRNHGWEPIIFTPENPDFDVKDLSGEIDVANDMEVLKLPIWEPYQLFKTLKGKSKKTKLKQGLVLESKNKTLLDKISIWLRGNVLIPDPRIFWLKPATKFLDDIIESKAIDVVISTGPPHSMHLIGLKIRQKYNVKWIADFRDPWSKWDLLDKLGTSYLAKLWHRKLEKKVLQKADLVLTVSNRLAKSFMQLGANNVEYITNGYDEEDYFERKEIKPSKFVLSHVGLLNEMRNPVLLWQVLEELCQSDSEFASNFEFRLGGIVSGSIVEKIGNSDYLKNNVVFIDYIPHQQIYDEYSKASLLLLIINNTDNSQWILPSKLYEYIYSGQPILMLGQLESDAADIISTFESSIVVDFEDKELLKSAILHFYSLFKKGHHISNTDNEKIEKYSRKYLTRELAKLMDDLTDGR
ncbi:MAG: glycosyltransferase family 4 protein [Cyclobacteriaceae bacterium]|nr:glycosyltransferase family 4 protein [Cyclobacteriaceae bacterium]